MRPSSRCWFAFLLAALTLGVLAGPAAAAADRYAYARECVAMRAADSNRFVTKGDAGWRATATSAGDAEAFRMHHDEEQSTTAPGT